MLWNAPKRNASVLEDMDDGVWHPETSHPVNVLPSKTDLIQRPSAVLLRRLISHFQAAGPVTLVVRFERQSGLHQSSAHAI